MSYVDSRRRASSGQGVRHSGVVAEPRPRMNGAGAAGSGYLPAPAVTEGTTRMRPQRSEELARAIADLIVQRGLPPGAPLPTELSLMNDLGVSRNSVRESVKALQALGIVEIRHGHGTFVGSASTSALQPWLLFRTRAGEAAGQRRLSDLLEVREIIKTELTRRVTLDHDDAMLAELQACVGRMRGTTVEVASRADRDFHEVLCNAAGVDLARDLIGLFWDVYRAAEAELEIPRPRRVAAAIHQRIVDGIASGDPDLAEAAVHAHFEEVRRRTKSGPYGSRSMPVAAASR